MAFSQTVHNQSSVMKINLMVVDDDPVFLEIMSRMLEKSKFREPLAMEVTVTAARDSQEALSTLKVQRNNIDLIITDYYMPGMNGLQLKRKITEEFGNLPVIVISSDANKEEESLTSGAVCFIPKPIKPSDLTKIYESALICKRNGKSILWTENNQNDNVPQNVQLLPEQQANVLKIKKNNISSRSVKITIGSSASTDGSRKNRKRSNGDDDESPSQPSKKRKISWTDHLHDLFLKAIRHIGLDKAVPKKILEYMNVPNLTRENVASHLQKYRIFLRKVAEQGLQCTNMLSSRGIDSVFSHGQIREGPYLNYYTRPSTSWYDSSLNNRSFYSNPGHGFGQSRLLCNTREPVRFNQMAYNYMNRSSTSYEPHHIGSNLTLPIQNNLNFSNQPSQNEGSTSFFQPSVMDNNASQTNQVLRIGQHEPSVINGNNLNCSVMSNYESLTPYQQGPSAMNSNNLNYGSLTPYQQGSSAMNANNLNFESLTPYQQGPSAMNGNNLNYESLTPHQQGPSQFSYEMQSFSNNESAAFNPEPHTNATTQPNLEVPQLENLNLYSDLGNTNEVSCNISNFHFDNNQVPAHLCEQQQQGEGANTNFKLPANFATELNQFLSLEDIADWNFVNTNQGHSIGETSNALTTTQEMNPPISNMNPNQNQEQSVPGFIDGSSLNPQELVDDDFLDSLFNDDMN